RLSSSASRRSRSATRSFAATPPRRGPSSTARRSRSSSRSTCWSWRRSSRIIWRSRRRRAGVAVLRPLRRPGSLAEDHRVDAPVARPAALRLLPTERQLLAIADRRDALRLDAEPDEVILDRLGALGPERQVVLDRAAIVAVPLELDLRAAVLPQPVGVAIEDGARFAVQVVLVEGEVHVLEDTVLFGREAAAGALEARPAEPLLAEASPCPGPRPGTRLRALLLACARERKQQRRRADRRPRPHRPRHASRPHSLRGDHAGEVSSAAPRVNSCWLRPSRSAMTRWCRPPRVEEKTR